MNSEVKDCDLVILFSGGADSFAMVKLAKELGKTPFCVLIYYEQLHADELNAAETYLSDKEIPYRIVSLTNLGVNSGLTGDGNKGRFEGVHEMYVPSRNLIFVGIAASVAEDLGIDNIWYGADWSDRLNDFPDCKQEWVEQLNWVLQINGPTEIKLEAPLLGLSKENILKYIEDFAPHYMQSGYGDL